MNKPIVIGVTGGSGSGKSSVSQQILEAFSPNCVLMMQQDNYYKDQSHLPFEERLNTNYDHPNAFDNDLFVEHIERLIQGETIDKPIYDFANHTRSQTVVQEHPRQVMLIEGILVLDDARLRDLMDIKVYVDTDDDVRLARRIRRDIQERGRTLDSVIDQYLNVVKPMHLQFIEPTKRYADVIVPEGGYNQVAIDLLTTKVASVMEAHDQV